MKFFRRRPTPAPAADTTITVLHRRVAALTARVAEIEAQRDAAVSTGEEYRDRWKTAEAQRDILIKAYNLIADRITRIEQFITGDNTTTATSGAHRIETVDTRVIPRITDDPEATATIPAAVIPDIVAAAGRLATDGYRPAGPFITSHRPGPDDTTVISYRQNWRRPGDGT